MPLTAEQRQFLGNVEIAAHGHVNDKALADQVRNFRQRYQVPDVTLAALLLEVCDRLQHALDWGTGTGGDLEKETNAVLDELALTAAALTRKQRGRSEL
jgi:hypothetical protein